MPQSRIGGNVDTDNRMGSARRFASGMDEARRPTGLILGTLLPFAALGCLMLVSALPVLLLPEVMAGNGLIVISAAFIVIWLIVWVWVRFKEKRPFAGLGFRRPALVPALRGAAVAAVLILAIVLIGVLAGGFEFLESPTGPAYWPSLGWVLLALAAFVVQSGAEELLARGYLVQVWYRRTGIVGAVIASTLFFTLMHGSNTGFGIMPLLVLIAVSIALVFWALAEGGLWGVISFHAVWNWAQGSLFGISVSGSAPPNSLFAVVETDGAHPLLTGGLYGLEGSLLTLGALALLSAGTITAFARMRSRRRG